MSTFSLSQLQSSLETVADVIGNHPLNHALEKKLNEQFPPDGEIVKAIENACHAGINEGAVCQREAGGIKFERIIQAKPELADCSVDLVYMKDVKGPHHRHPLGEIDLIMPISADAKFDERGAGWLVYGPDSAHRPTVSEGDALVLYLLPNGEIEFTRT